jgi:hypothetical protein
VLAEAPTTSAQYAALELQNHLKKITGEEVPIIREPAKSEAPVKIAVGNTKLAKAMGFPVDALAPFEFLIAGKGGTIVLAGGDDPATAPADWGIPVKGTIGTCYAVYEFLETYCGVHWYLPGEDGMVYPTEKVLKIRMGDTIRRRPDFQSTSLWPPYINKKMFWIPGSGPLNKGDILSAQEHLRWQIRNKVGGEPYAPNHSFGNWIAEHGVAHPEWFSWKTKEKVDQVLAKDAKDAAREFNLTGQPCLSSPGVLAQVVADARDFFDNGNKNKKHPGSQGRFFSVGLNDNYEMCQCPECKALYNQPTAIPGDGSASRYYWNFVNQVAREIRKTHPDKWISSIAYFNYTVPPADFTLEPNVAISVCNIQGNWTPELREQGYRLIDAWRNGAKAQRIGLWEYFNFQRQITGVPRVAPRLLGEDAKTVYKKGVVAEFVQVEAYGEPGIKEAVKNLGYPANWIGPIRNYLNVWIRFKLRDDTQRDVGSLLDEHYRLFYGPAADPMRKFFETIETRVTDMSLRGPETFTNERSLNPKIDWEYLCPPEVMKALRRLVDEATQSAPGEPYKTRVGWVRAGVMEAMEKEQARYFEDKANSPSPGRAEAVSYFLKQAPVIDGDGGDAAWAGLPLGVLNEYKTGVKPKEETTFRMGYDNENLYVLLNCADSDVKNLRTVRTLDSNVWLDDCAELFLSFDPEKKTSAHLIVNALGTVQDAMRREDGEDTTWDLPGLEAKTKVHESGYTVELKIPLKPLGCPAEPTGLRFFANLCRQKYSGSSNATPDALMSWSPAPDGFGDSSSFGQILLTAADAAHVFFSQESGRQAATLYAVDQAGKWTPIRDGMLAEPEKDHIRFEMNCPAENADIKKIEGNVVINFDPPVDVSENPYVEIRFLKENKDTVMKISYAYRDGEGKDASNYFPISLKGGPVGTVQTFVWDLNKGVYKNKPAPKFLKKITIMAEPQLTPEPVKQGFSLYSIRLCKETLRGASPELVPAGTGMH